MFVRHGAKEIALFARGQGNQNRAIASCRTRRSWTRIARGEKPHVRRDTSRTPQERSTAASPSTTSSIEAASMSGCIKKGAVNGDEPSERRIAGHNRLRARPSSKNLARRRRPRRECSLAVSDHQVRRAAGLSSLLVAAVQRAVCVWQWTSTTLAPSLRLRLYEV